MKDTIYREDAIKAFDTEPFIVGDAEAAINTYSYMCDVIRRIKNLPPAEPERKRGHWIEADDSDNRISGRCSVCGWESHLYEDDVVGMDFCPNCGADMKGDRDEQE